MKIETAERLIDRLLIELERSETRATALEAKLVAEQALSETLMAASTAEDLKEAVQLPLRQA